MLAHDRAAVLARRLWHQITRDCRTPCAATGGGGERDLARSERDRLGGSAVGGGQFAREPALNHAAIDDVAPSCVCACALHRDALDAPNAPDGDPAREGRVRHARQLCSLRKRHLAHLRPRIGESSRSASHRPSHAICPGIPAVNVHSPCDAHDSEDAAATEVRACVSSRGSRAGTAPS